jgi:hypothetical protein
VTCPWPQPQIRTKRERAISLLRPRPLDSLRASHGEPIFTGARLDPLVPTPCPRLPMKRPHLRRCHLVISGRNHAPQTPCLTHIAE